MNQAELATATRLTNRYRDLSYLVRFKCDSRNLRLQWVNKGYANLTHVEDIWDFNKDEAERITSYVKKIWEKELEQLENDLLRLGVEPPSK